MMKYVLRTTALFLFLSLIAGLSAAQYAKVSSGSKIMISAHPLAAKAGLEVYRKGGNVVDVAVAVAYALGVVEPHGSGIGGEGMMIIYDAREKKATIVDFKGVSPQSASNGTLNLAKASEWARSAKGASVPGAVAGLELARERFGRLDRKTVMQPAVDYAINGYEVDSTLALNLESYKTVLEKDPYARSIYYPKGEPAKRGTTMKNQLYGKSLQVIQRDGADAFYKGEIAGLIVNDAKKRGGFISGEDLAAYMPLIRQPLEGEYRGYTILTTPPPCGGMFLIEALNILKHFDLAECRKDDDYNLHLFAEMSKLMSKDEATFNGDPEFSTIPARTITSERFAFQRLLQIDLAHARDAKQIEAAKIPDKNTTQLCVMDIEGNTVSLTITLSSLFGTGQTVEGGGFMLNNEMQNFNADPNHPNSLQPHKRVVTSLVPTIIMKNGRPLYALGTPGGDLILSTVAQVVVNLLEFRMPLREAVYAPRSFSFFSQKEMDVENRYPAASIEQLESLGHSVRKMDGFRAYFGAVQSIMYDADAQRLLGCSDPRRSGAAVGE